MIITLIGITRAAVSHTGVPPPCTEGSGPLENVIDDGSDPQPLTAFSSCHAARSALASRQVVGMSAVSIRSFTAIDTPARHSDFGGTTGVDFLLGFFDPKIAAMSFEDRTDHFLDVAQEDILGATQ